MQYDTASFLFINKLKLESISYIYPSILRTDLLEIYSLDGKSYILAVFGNYPPTLPTPAVYQRCLATTSRLY